MNPARKAAYFSLLKTETNGAFSNLETLSAEQSEALSPENRGLYRQLYFGVIEKKIPLDYLLSRMSDHPLNRLDAEVLCILELGALQILYLDRIPDHAALHESGELAKRFCRHCLPMVNAILRRLIREKDTVFSLLNFPGKKGLSLKYGYPKHLIGLWQESYGTQKCLEIMEAQNQRAAMTLRINTLKTDANGYAALLDQARIPYHFNSLCRNAITLEHPQAPFELPGFADGLFFIQDAAAARAVDRLGAKPGERILDLCAAPGGKSFGAAMDMEGRGTVVSLELHPSRLNLIREGAKRLGIEILTASQNDSSVPNSDFSEAFDRVICDVPCSGYGTIAKKPDIRHKSKEDSENLPEIQKKILEAGALAVKSGGFLLYSTCTLNPAENEKITDDFLERHPEFSRVGEKETIFPKGGENDGFFCDLLEKL